MPTSVKGKFYKGNIEYQCGNSWNAEPKIAADKVIWSSTNYDEFLQKMKLTGYELRQEKNLMFRPSEPKTLQK